MKGSFGRVLAVLAAVIYGLLAILTLAAGIKQGGAGNIAITIVLLILPAIAILLYAAGLRYRVRLLLMAGWVMMLIGSLLVIALWIAWPFMLLAAPYTFAHRDAEPD
jgi:hypothetical protein